MIEAAFVNYVTRDIIAWNIMKESFHPHIRHVIQNDFLLSKWH